MLNEKEEDEKGFEWINTNHPRIYATTAVAEQNSLSTFNSNTMFIPKEVLTQPWPNVYAQVKLCISFYVYNASRKTLWNCITTMLLYRSG